MAYEFKSKLLEDTDSSSIMLAMFEGDNEYAIVNVPSSDEHTLFIINHGGDEEHVLLEEWSSDLSALIEKMNEFLINEYAGA